MVNKKSSVIIAAIGALFCFVSVVYVSSCTKPGKEINCDYYACRNGGYCHVDSINKVPAPHCVCPTGYEGPYCDTASASKFLGSWDVKQTVIGSDSLDLVGKDSSYSVLLYASGTPTTFMIYNLCGDANYNDIICTIDSTNTYKFVIDTLSSFHMVFDHFKLLQNATGTIIPNTSITTVLDVYRLNYNINWEHDTLSILMTPHKN